MRRIAAARVLGAVGALAIILSAPLLAGQDTPAETGNLAVTVKYTGAGTVDKDHRIWVWLFDNPNTDTWADTQPLAVGMLTENATAYKFTGLPKQIYFAMAYDDKGGYDGTTGAPPAGTPISVYGMSSSGAAVAVDTGDADQAVETSFDDTMRMP
jgi:uncharacterized protein (DUF2141 family)